MMMTTMMIVVIIIISSSNCCIIAIVIISIITVPEDAGASAAPSATPAEPAGALFGANDYTPEIAKMKSIGKCH